MRYSVAEVEDTDLAIITNACAAGFLNKTQIYVVWDSENETRPVAFALGSEEAIRFVSSLNAAEGAESAPGAADGLWTVVGLRIGIEDKGGRYEAVVQAQSVSEAEDKARAFAPCEIAIVGVLEGSHDFVGGEHGDA